MFENNLNCNTFVSWNQ